MQSLTTNRRLRAMRALGALALLATGAVHLQEYLGADYSAIPTVGPLFLLNAIAAGIVGVALLLPIERALTGRQAKLWVVALALAGVAIAVGSLVALFISESSSLFGFSESGYHLAVVVAIVAEVATVALLAPVAAITRLSGAGRPGREVPSGRRSAWPEPTSGA